eukprot:8649087-Pyramimonas_sp.AAC.1
MEISRFGFVGCKGISSETLGQADGHVWWCGMGELSTKEMRWGSLDGFRRAGRHPKRPIISGG